MSSIARLQSFVTNPNVKAFLRVIRFCEGTADEAGYRRMFGGNLFDDFKDHPRKAHTFTLRQGGRLTSTAAGAYQFLSRTWDGLVRQYGFKDFSPGNQDLAAIALIDGRKALGDLVKGDLPTVVRKCNLEWASLPESPYGQPVKKYEEVQRVYFEHGGMLSPQGEPRKVPETPQEPPKPLESPSMLSILAPVVKAGLLEVVPKLVDIFGSGSEVSERNLKAVEAVAEVAKNAIGARNEQEMLETIRRDPEAVKAVKAAIQENWMELEEIGGGIEAAKKYDMAVMMSDEPWYVIFKSPSFVVGFFGLLPLVYLIVLSIIGLIGNAEWSPEVRASLAGAITGAIVGGLVGYYYGQTTSRNRTPK